MSLSDLPRGYDAWRLRGPDERDIDEETERRNASYDEAYEQARDDEDRDEMRKP